MLESPDYFFRVREIGRLRQTTLYAAEMRLRIPIDHNAPENPRKIFDAKCNLYFGKRVIGN